MFDTIANVSRRWISFVLERSPVFVTVTVDVPETEIPVPAAIACTGAILVTGMVFAGSLSDSKDSSMLPPFTRNVSTFWSSVLSRYAARFTDLNGSASRWSESRSVFDTISKVSAFCKSVSVSFAGAQLVPFHFNT